MSIYFILFTNNKQYIKLHILPNPLRNTDANEALLAAKKRGKKSQHSYIAGHIWWPDTLHSMKSYYYLFFIMISKTFKILLGSNLLIAHYPLLSSDCLCILFPPPLGCLQALLWRGLPFPCLEYSGSQEGFLVITMNRFFRRL